MRNDSNWSRFADRYSKFKPYNEEMRAREELALGHLYRNVRFPLDEAGRLVTSRTEIVFLSVPERS